MALSYLLCGQPSMAAGPAAESTGRRSDQRHSH